uniref:Uncharacterized protein n=1 Tax=Myoviridae sp. ctwwN25 TaxID=2825209 RepID=A0A8S5PQ79_9CAUD|nr:MAG TPA: hypothetical protein [Myoviridae sp. ctwwN25]
MLPISDFSYSTRLFTRVFHLVILSIVVELYSYFIISFHFIL